MGTEATGRMVLGIDLEGMNENLMEKGVNIDVDRVTEVGAVLWDFERSAPVQILSELIDEPDRLPISDEVQEITGIDDKMLKEWGLKKPQTKNLLTKLQNLIKKADYLMAHNGQNYDLPMLRALFQRNDLEFPEKTWIDTAKDIEYPRRIHLHNLASLEHAHGFINPFPHRAVTDVLSMLKIASNYPLERMVALAESPIVTLIAKLKAPNWKDPDEVEKFQKVKHKVAKSKFRWNPGKKTWSRKVHKVLLDEGKYDFDFDWYIQTQDD